MHLTSVLALSTPVFALLILLEMAYYRIHPDENSSGYTVRDTATSVTVGLGSTLADIAYKSAALTVFAALYELTPLRVPVTWASFPLILLAQDFCYYWMHREHHRVRILWASHVVHHSSLQYNFSTAGRSSWTGFTGPAFYVPLALLGVPPHTILLCSAINLISQFWLHTDRIGRLPRFIETVFNTPSNHRVHHASQGDYLDRNFGGILMVWDRIFGTWAEEVDRPVYGLTKNIGTHNPLRVLSHEYASIGRDVARATHWRDRVGHLFGRPGRRPVRGSILQPSPPPPRLPLAGQSCRDVTSEVHPPAETP